MGRRLALFSACLSLVSSDGTTSPTIFFTSSPTLSMEPSAAPSTTAPSTAAPSMDSQAPSTAAPSMDSQAPSTTTPSIAPSAAPIGSTAPSSQSPTAQTLSTTISPTSKLTLSPSMQTLFPTTMEPTLHPTFGTTFSPTHFPTTSAPSRAPTTSMPSIAFVPYCSKTPTHLYAPGYVNYTTTEYNSSNFGCAWVLHGPPGSSIVVNFSAIFIDEGVLGCQDCDICDCDQQLDRCPENDIAVFCPRTCGLCGSCEYNYVAIRDISGEYFRFCGYSNQSYVVPTTTGTVLVALVRGLMQHSPDPSVTSVPLPASDALAFTWDFTYNSTGPVLFTCSGEVSLNVSSIPRNITTGTTDYPDGILCAWHLTAPLGQFVLLEFTSFDLQPAVATDEGPLCFNDIVQVVNPDSRELLAVLCGNALPSTILSSSSRLSVYFASDAFFRRPGFTAQVRSSPIGATFCKGNVSLDQEGRVFESANYPPSKCIWIITAPEGMYVEISFLSFSVEGPSPTCPWDYFTVMNVSGPTLLKTCGESLPVNVTSLTNQVIVSFVADQIQSRNGFEFQYRWVTKPGPTPLLCEFGSEIYAPLNYSGYIQDGSAFGAPHDLDMNCTWRVMSPTGTHLHVYFLEFALNSNCSIDALSIWNGPNRSFPLVGVFCGNNTPLSLDTFTSGVYMEYVSKNALGGGFLANFAVMGEHIRPLSACQGSQILTIDNGTKGNLTDGWSGAVPSTPQDCVWSITAPENSFVKLTVDLFSTEMADDGCRSQYLSAFDGPDEAAYAFFAHCGTMSRLGVPVITTQRTLLIHFANSAQMLAGFSARWEFVSTPGNKTGRHCYGVTNLPLNNEITGVIRQFGTLVDVRRGISCGWAVQAPKNYRVRAMWGGLKSHILETAGYCGDYVTLDDTVKVCSNAPRLVNYTTSGTLLNVRMVAMHGLSFNLTWLMQSTSPSPSLAVTLPKGGAGVIAAAVLVPIFIVVMICFGIYCWKKRTSPERHFDLDNGQELETVERSPRLSSDTGAVTHY